MKDILAFSAGYLLGNSGQASTPNTGTPDFSNIIATDEDASPNGDQPAEMMSVGVLGRAVTNVSSASGVIFTEESPLNYPPSPLHAATPSLTLSIRPQSFLRSPDAAGPVNPLWFETAMAAREISFKPFALLRHSNIPIGPLGDPWFERSTPTNFADASAFFSGEFSPPVATDSYQIGRIGAGFAGDLPFSGFDTPDSLDEINIILRMTARDHYSHPETLELHSATGVTNPLASFLLMVTHNPTNATGLLEVVVTNDAHSRPNDRVLV